MPLRFTVRRSAYFDSIALMSAAEDGRKVAGVSEVAVVMGTPANRSMLRDAELLPPDAPETEPSDLLISVRADSDDSARVAVLRVEERLAARRDEPSRVRVRPRTVTSAARRTRGANVAFIAVPGPYAAIDAHQALAAGLHAFVFSDGVSIDDEIRLKRRARERGLLVMGPECGTTIVNGVGLGFANRVRRGAIGVVGASGTGIQEITILIHQLGSGISHAIGTGGRDLHAAVGGITTLQAIALLAADDDTRVLVIVSKPSSREVADRVLTAAVATGKPVVACLLGDDGPTPNGVRLAATLEDAAMMAVRLAGGSARELERPRSRVIARGVVCGLYSGGTLCEEAKRIAGVGHRFVDFGAEEFTRGRPHPIIDMSRRQAAILDAANDPHVAVLLLDVVIGDCAHADPAGALAPALGEARERARREGRELQIVTHVVGTDDDFQDRRRQEQTLAKIGAIVCATNRIAADTARRITEGADESSR